MLLALHSFLLLAPLGGPSRWYIIGDKRYRFTPKELAQFLATLPDEPEIAEETPAGPKPAKWRLVQSVRQEAKRIKAPIDDDEEDELIFLLAYA